MSLYPSFMNYRLLKEQRDDYQEHMLHCLYRHDDIGYRYWKKQYNEVIVDMHKVGGYIESYFPRTQTDQESADNTSQR